MVSLTSVWDRLDIVSLVLGSGKMPWENVSPVDIQRALSSGASSLDVDENLGDPFTVVLRYGLSLDSPGRQMSLEQIRDMLAEYLSVMCLSYVDLFVCLYLGSLLSPGNETYL